MTTHGENERLLARIFWSTPRAKAVDDGIEAFEKRLADAGERDDQDGDDGDDEATVLPVLPTETDDRLALLIVHPEGEEHHWSLVLADPPDEGDEDDRKELTFLRKAAEAAGGRKQIAALAAAGWKTPPSVEHRVHFHLSAEKWTCPTIPESIGETSVDRAALNIGSDAIVDTVGYRFKNGANGISHVQIRLGAERPAYFVDVTARGLLRFGADRWLPFADDLKQVVLGSLFERRGNDA